MRLVRGIGRRIAALPPFAVLLIGWLFLILYAFPGQMTQDSFDHLRALGERAAGKTIEDV